MIKARDHMEDSGGAAGPTSTSSQVGKNKKGIVLPEGEVVEEVGKRKKKMRWCQADNCNADLSEAKVYHRRHKVCDLHFKSTDVLVTALHQRFCQQCSRFHELWEFDGAKRSCRRRLAGHNERRRKNSLDSSTAI